MTKEELSQLKQELAKLPPLPWERCPASDGKCPCASIWSRPLDRPLFSMSPTHDGVAPAPHKEWTELDYRIMDFVAKSGSIIIELINQLEERANA